MKRGYQSFPLLLKRIINYLAVQLQYRLATPYVRGHPYVLIIDTINICNLKCPLCPTGVDMPGRPKGRMDFSLFKRIIDVLGDYALTLVLYNWGEPLLNKNIYSMIEYAKQRSIKTIVSSNLNILNEKDAETLVKSGLDRLIVSLDGTKSETYEEYRKGGNYHRVIANIELLVRKKAEMKSSKPKVTWQFLVFKHNVQDIPEIKRTAKQLRVDGVDIFGAYLGGPRQTPYIRDEGTKELASKWLFQTEGLRDNLITSPIQIISTETDATSFGRHSRSIGMGPFRPVVVSTILPRILEILKKKNSIKFGTTTYLEVRGLFLERKKCLYLKFIPSVTHVRFSKNLAWRRWGKIDEDRD